MMGDYQRQLVSMIEEFLSPATPNTKRVLLGKEIGDFSQQSSECLTILATTYPNSPINRHLIMFTLATIESSIKKVAVGDERRMEFFTTFTTFLAEHTTLPSSTQKTLVRLIVETAMYYWSHFYPVLVTQVISLLSPTSSIASQQLGLSMVMEARPPEDAVVSTINEVTEAILCLLERPAQNTPAQVAREMEELCLKCLGHIFTWCRPSLFVSERLVHLLFQSAALNTNSSVSLRQF